MRNTIISLVLAGLLGLGIGYSIGHTRAPAEFGGTTKGSVTYGSGAGVTITTGNLALTSGNASVGGTLGVTGATDVGIFTQGGGCLSISTTSATYTLTEAQLLAYNCIEIASTESAAQTFTLPATSTMTTLLPSAGDTRRWIWENQHAAATTTTIAKGAGIDLVAVTANDDVIDGTEYSQMTCTRQTDTDVVCVLDELLAAD